jgi:molybdate transport system substrate-binding protein
MPKPVNAWRQSTVWRDIDLQTRWSGIQGGWPNPVFAAVRRMSEKKHSKHRSGVLRKASLTAALGFAFLRPGAAQEIRVAAAADLQPLMQDVAAQFQKETSIKVQITYGSSGDFFHQIESGAPFDMFFSANLEYAKKLESAGLALTGTYYQYARGKIVIWVPKETKLDLDLGLSILVDPSVRKIAVADPHHAPYGQAAIAALTKEKIYDKVKDKLVFGENVSQAASFLLVGAADAGIVALSLTRSPQMRDKGRYVEIPAGEYPPIEQACVILATSKNKEAARQFLSFFKTPPIGKFLRDYGFDLP